MRCHLAFLLFAGLLGSCNPQGERVTLGQPTAKALRTTELAADGRKRLTLLSTQKKLTSNSLFTHYQKRSASQWSSGWTRSLDFSGVSWSHRQAGTAITPRHIVLAAHYTLKIGTSVTFHERSGKVHSRKIEKLISFRGQKVASEKRSDIAVALLDRPLPPTIKTYRLLPPRSDYPHTLPGAPAVVTEQGRRAFIHQVRRVSTKTISFEKNPDVPEPLYKSLIKGDSGHPSFILVGGEPVLIETHTGGGPGSGPFYSSPPLFKALKEAVAQLDPSYQIKTVPLDPQLAPAPPVAKPPEKIAPPRVRRAPHSSPSPSSSPTQTTPRLPRVRRVPTSPN